LPESLNANVGLVTRITFASKLHNPQKPSAREQFNKGKRQHPAILATLFINV
jgi:hypothetical protein